MELQEFLEKFLPDCEEKWLHDMYYDKDEDNPEYTKLNPYDDLDFIIQYFPEALRNYTDRICEKQRENCAIVAIKYTKYDRILVENAKQPKIEEL